MNYQNGKIYCIRNHINDEVYVGSTTQSLSKRMATHRIDMKTSKKDMMLYALMNEIGVEHFYIELIEECLCENKDQLRKKEGEHIRQMGTLNKRIAGRSRKEYHEDNREAILERQKEYHTNNREAILQKQKEYHTNNREARLNKQKEYHEANKDNINERRRERRQQQKNINSEIEEATNV